VETDRPGFGAIKLTGKPGIRASDTAEIRFNDVRVPKENLIDEKEEKGFPQIMQLFCMAISVFPKSISPLKRRHY